MKRLLSLFGLVILSSLVLQAGSIAGYNTAAYVDVKTVQSKLQKNGFKVLASYHPAGKAHLNVLLFTCPGLQKASAKKTRGFAAVQRVLVNDKTKTVLVSNPEYWLKAFLQGDYDDGIAKKVASKLGAAFGQMTPTADALEGSDLAKYHFMMAMPYYEDMLTLKEGVTKANVGNTLFSLDLGNGSTLLGVKMDAATESFIDKIGEDKALVLPYLVLVEEDKAYALHAKYYLAISYPKLSMGQFMTISSTPGKIEKSLQSSIK